MSKRKLNKQQRGRIASNQAATSDNVELLYGLVISHYGKEVEVLAVNANRVAEPAAGAITQRCHFRAKLPTIVCGDYVRWQAPGPESATGVVEALLERESLLQRPRPYEDPKPVAANIDTIFITLSPSPEPITSLIDRFLIAAENAGIAAALVLNKVDLLEQNSAIAQELEQLLTLYKDLGYPVYRYSAFTAGSESASEFHAALINKTSILVGQSGVGKSSIINALAGEQSAKTGEISEANDKGKHTTTTSQLYRLLAGKASIIDSPGIREFGLWHLTPNDIINGLPEFQRYALQCKFRDCEHGNSKGCELQAAIERGDIHPSRVSSYYHILDSLEK